MVGSAVIALVFSGEIKGGFNYMSMSSRLLREEKLLSLFVLGASLSFSLSLFVVLDDRKWYNDIEDKP